MRWLFTLLLLVALGCSNNPDALYAKTSHAADSGAPAAAKPEPLPKLPARPDIDHQSDCERCAASTCSQARANCLEDDDCTDELRCKGTCDDPECLQTCSAKHGWSAWYADYANCVFGQCRGACNVGKNWQCLGHYDWPAAPDDARSFEVVFNFRDPPTYFLGSQLYVSAVGDTATACDDVQDCGSGLDSAEVGIDNKVKLALAASAFPPKDFRGYLDLEHSHTRFYPPPLARAQEYYPGGPSAGQPPAVDLARARVIAIVVDCLVAPVSGAIVTLPEFPSIPTWRIDLNRFEWSQGPTNEVGGASLVDLPESAADNKLLVRAVRADMQPISERAIWVRPAFDTFVILGPATSTD